MSSLAPSFEIVAAAENNYFFLWQALLFHYSCLTYQGQAPVIVVHAHEDDALLPGFELITRHGGRIQRAPNWRSLDGVNYPPRNTICALKHVRTTADFIVLCDADMVFRRAVNWANLPIRSDGMTFDRVFYLDPHSTDYQPFVDDACRAAQVSPQWLRDIRISGGVPHVIPTARQLEIADEWLHCISYFPTQGPSRIEDAGSLSRGVHQGTQQWWLSIMWAALLMVQRLKLTPVLTEFCLLNLRGDQVLPECCDDGPAMIHYCYPGTGFNKHHFDHEFAYQSSVWRVAESDGTLNGLVRGQLREAGRFYGFEI